MIVSVLKMDFRKLPPRVISYKDFSNYDNANFISSLEEVLCENENAESFLKDFDYFYKVCTEVLNKHAPPKKKYVPGNNKPFMNKAILKAIMLRKKLRNKLLKYPTTANRSFKETFAFLCYEKKRKNILPISM